MKLNRHTETAMNSGATGSWTAPNLRRCPSGTNSVKCDPIKKARRLWPAWAMRTLITALTLAWGSSLSADERTLDYDYDPPKPGTYTLPVIKPASDGPVLGADGELIRLAELTRGRITVMSFIYTRCAATKACPMATGVLRLLHHKSSDDPALAKELRLVSMSFDPVNDTPERMMAYSALASKSPNAAPWHFVTAPSQVELQPVLASYGQAVDVKKNAFDPTGPLNHTLRVFLIDRGGNIRNIYSSATLDIRLIVADIKTLLMDSPELKEHAASSKK